MKVSQMITQMQGFCTEKGVDFKSLVPKVKGNDKSICSFWSRDNNITLSARKVKGKVVFFLRIGVVLYISNGMIVSFK